ncbi:MAG: FAD-dependent oxidoreductase, partial [Desulfobacterales bacterium]|nr:FAD-dependent oxidoreductase [Desulfobacterales bacterium]
RSGYAYLARNVKDAVSIPVMASNRITTPDEAETIIKEGGADMVNLGRVLIADPRWPIKAKEGRPNEIRPCVACSQGCTDEIFSGRPVFCVGNPRAGFEGERKIVKTRDPKKVLIAGAGAAGLEAAVTATRIGHQVEILEKSDRIGGQLHLAGAPPHKQELLEYIRYYQAMVEKYKISITFNTEATEAVIKERNPDHLIIAEGAEPLVPPIPGVDDPRVISSWDVLRDNPPLGKKAAVIGGGAVGLETALHVAFKGTLCPDMLHFLFTYNAAEVERIRELMFNGTSKVTVFEMLPKVGKDVGKSTKWVLMGNLDRYGVEIRTNARVTSIEDGRIVYEIDGKEESEQFDNVILASGSRSRQVLMKQAESFDIPCSSVGDCVNPGRINDAVHGGFLAALAV